MLTKMTLKYIFNDSSKTYSTLNVQSIFYDNRLLYHSHLNVSECVFKATLIYTTHNGHKVDVVIGLFTQQQT